MYSPKECCKRVFKGIIALNLTCQIKRHRPGVSNVLCFVAVCLLNVSGSSCRAQEPPDDVPLAPRVTAPGESYRLRVENREYGSISLSADGGLHYTLIGRVTRPASTVALDREAQAAGQVGQGGGTGFAFAVNLGQSLKLRPASVSAPTGAKRGQAASFASEPFSIVTNLAPRTGLFGDLLPPVGGRVKLESDGFQHGFPTPYQPSTEDAYVFVVARPAQGTEEASRLRGFEGTRQGTGVQAHSIQESIAALGQAYTTQSLDRARQEHRAIVSGILHLQARLPEGEPDPIDYVTYSIDGRAVSQQNVKPFSYDWDTRRAEDGEHVVEVRALNRNLHLITYKRTLVVVQNKPG